MVETLLDRLDILKDVRVIIFEVIQNGGAGTVVHKLASLIKEAGVIFVTLNHKVRALGRQPRAVTEVRRHAADQVPRSLAAGFKNPGEHRARRGLAVRAGHRHHVASLQNMFADPLRTRGIRFPGIQNRFEKRVAARNRVPDHPEIRMNRQLLFAIPFIELNTETAKLIAHRRVDPRVAPRDLMPRLNSELRHAAHESSANS